MLRSGQLVEINDDRPVWGAEHLLICAVENQPRPNVEDWWESDSNDTLRGNAADFVETEAEASAVRNLQMTLVPDLLQTADYATALVRSFMTEPDEAVVEERSRLRQQRQARLTDKSRPLHLHALVHESALEQNIGGLDTMLHQLDRLVTSAALPTVTLQLVAKSVGEYPGFGTSYHLIDFDTGGDAAVYLENLTWGLYIEEETEVSAYTLNFEGVLEHALDPEATVEWIKEIQVKRARERKE